MAKFRIWHSSRDAYHCAFRFIRILSAAERPVPFEQLRVLDLFLLYPQLLHHISMTSEMRSNFRKLDIEKPEAVFVRLPGIALLSQELRVFQNVASAYLVGKGILEQDLYKKSIANLKAVNLPDEIRKKSNDRNKADQGLMEFMTHELASLPLAGADNLFRRTGLPNRAIRL